LHIWENALDSTARGTDPYTLLKTDPKQKYEVETKKAKSAKKAKTLSLERISIACTDQPRGARGKENEGLLLTFFIPVTPVLAVVGHSLPNTYLKSDLFAFFALFAFFVSASTLTRRSDNENVS
jgi:hypothetical protein